MFYKNNLKTRKTKTFKVGFETFAKNPMVDYEDKKNGFDEANIHYNFKVSKGYLENGYGIKSLALPTSYSDLSVEETVTFPSNKIDYIWDFHWFGSQLGKTYNYVFYLDGNGNLYYFDEIKSNSMFQDTGADFTSVPTCFPYEVNNSDVLVFSSFSDGIVVCVGGNVTTSFANAEKMLSCCFHENCFYGILATDDNQIVFGKDIDVLHWDQMVFSTYTFYDEGGRLRKLISFNDYVYVFRDRSIVKIYPFSVNTNISVTNMYFSSSLIVANSIASCGELIIFLTKDGLYSFNGSIVSKLDVKIAEKIKIGFPDNIASLCYHGKYFLACNIDFGDNETVGCESSTYVNNAVLIYDIESKQVEIMRGVDIKDFATLENVYMSKILCTFNGGNNSKIGEFTTDGSVFGTSFAKKWKSKKTDFGYKNNTKIIKNVLIQASQDCTLTVVSDAESKSFSIAGNQNLQKIKLNIKGKVFDISISSTAASQKIKVPEFEVEVLL